MCWSIDFWHYLHSIQRSSLQNFVDIACSVNFRVAVFASFWKFRVRDQNKREGLVINNMPMKNVEFGKWHGSNESNDASNTQIMSSWINHDSSILQQRCIGDMSVRDFVIFDELWQRFKGVNVSWVVSIFYFNFSLLNDNLIPLRFELGVKTGGQRNMLILYKRELFWTLEIGI